MLIAISCGKRITKTSSGMIETHSLVPYFNDLINEQGGTGIIIPQQNTLNIDSLMSIVDGLIITGGGDINPELYNEKNTHSKNISDERDNLEMSLLSLAEKNRIRTLAICRGNQMLNVYKGGNLIQDIPSKFNDVNSHDEIHDKTSEHVHDVHIDKKSKLYGILDEQTIHVNSIHHQCVNELGEGITISAKSSDGIVEGIETSSDWEAIGIQWHPEYLKNDEVSKKLFGWLIHS
ncbi:MAG: gamma-glutamyl-gamma-aminobutyrate hydrolase family protein [Actinomycetota bacterium]|nr:gamma-glutamyl-gamma-aminobutyrate hydrolase family protein [Actinomycetota bacterium]